MFPRLQIPSPAPSWRYDRPDGFFGLSMLYESEGALGLLLWRAAQVVRRRVEVRSDRRIALSHATLDRLRGLFTDEAGECGIPPAVFEVFARALARGETATDSELGDACTRLREWAGATWRSNTEVHFAELAARVDAESPERANAAGRICRNAGLMDRAGVWFERGFRLAVRHKNRTESVRALLGYGAIMKESGRLEEARRWFLKAARRAARTGRRKRAAETRHDLMALAAEAGDLAEVLVHASAAVELYPLHHRRLPYLAHDLAFALVRSGQYELALPLLESFVRVVPTRYMLPGMATFAWAAAGRGLAHRYDDAERRVLNLVSTDEHQAAPSLIFLAEGARLLGRWDRAERHASEAIRHARRLEQGRYERDAEALRTAILAKVRELPTADVEMRDLAPLARELTTRLRRWKASRSRSDQEKPGSQGDSRAVGNGQD